MRYTKQYKDEARHRLLAASGSHAKQHGFGGSGMSALAAAAGVTTGSLYKHFDGKADLFASVISAELARAAERYAATGAKDATSGAKALASYLSLQHIQHPENGCPLPSLAAEVARADDSVREAFQTGLLAIHANVEKLTGSSEAAWTLIAQNVGAVMIGRAMSDEKLKRGLLKALRRAGEGLLRDGDGGMPPQ